MTDPQQPQPPLPRAVLGVGLVLLLVLGLGVGALLGDAQSHAELEDPTEVYEQERLALAREVSACTPDLTGAGPLGDPAQLDALRLRLTDLRRRAADESISLDLLDIDAALHRAELERALRGGDVEAARAVARRFADQPVGMLLEARLELASGERPAPEPLQVLAQSPDDALAEAARLLLAHLLAEDSPDEALEALSERVRPGRDAAIRARIDLHRAASRLDAAALERCLAADPPAPARRKATLQAVRAGLRLTGTRPLPVADLEPMTRALLLLGGVRVQGEDEAVRLVRGVIAGLREGPPPGEDGISLLERLAECGLRCGEAAEAASLLDHVAAAPPGGVAQATLRLRLLVALARLGARLEAVHLRGLPLEAAERLPRDAWSDYLRARLQLLAGGEEQAAGRTALRALVEGPRGADLGPIERAEGLLEASREATPAEARALLQRALGLDPDSPWLRLAFADALARGGEPQRALSEAEGAQVLFDRVSRERLGEEQARLRLLRGLTLVHARRGDEGLTQIFLQRLAREGDPEQAAVAAEARAALRGE